MNKSKHFTAILFIALALTLPCCKAARKLTQFTIKTTQTVILPSTIGVNLPFNIITPPIPTNSMVEFERNNTNADLVESVQLRRLRLKVISPESGDFSFLKSVRVFQIAEGQPETQVAWRDNIPDNIGREMDLQTTNANLKAFLIKDKISLRVSTVADKLIASEYHISLEADFFVDARIFGL
ncbi:MAG TPA: hypothetical protein PKE03_08780 [Bacteroidales bacterium]|nr:hypothetical protein [Bacteroidales bacterium]